MGRGGGGETHVVLAYLPLPSSMKESAVYVNYFNMFGSARGGGLGTQISRGGGRCPTEGIF